MNSRCINCKMYLAVDQSSGQCRLNPPIFAILADNARKWLYPGVAVDHWCGQYVGKEKEVELIPAAAPLVEEQKGIQNLDTSLQPQSERKTEG